MNSVRIVAGKFGGRLIATPKNKVTQPMGDRERSAIFNILRDDVEGAVVLDAFAGSGALGLEALSRGATRADFLERDTKAVATIAENIEKLKLGYAVRIVKKPQGLIDSYSLIFMDPPYDNVQMALVEQLAEKLSNGGVLVLSHPAEAVIPEFRGLTLMADRKYAAARIKIYRKY